MDKNLNRTQWLTRTAMLLAVAIAVQAMHMPQLLTGSLVNAVLILAVIFTGLSGGLIIGAITPWMAFMLAILPPALAPLIPVIMLANMTLAALFFLVRKNNDFLAAGVASLAKYLVFFLAINYLLQLLGVNLPPKLVAAFGITQLFTALIGSICAVLVGRALGREFSAKI